MFRRVLIGAATVLAAGVVVVDRVAASVAGGRVADRLQRTESLEEPPTVTFGGFPFLFQALGGNYSDVAVTARDLRRGPVLIARIEARLHGVRLRLLDALRGRLGAVTVDSVEATALFRYPDLAAALANCQVTISEDNGGIRLHAAVMIFGQRLAGSALGDVRVDREQLTFVPRDFSLDAGGRTVRLSPALAAALTYSVPVNLPFGLRLMSVQQTPDGLLVHAFGTALVLRPDAAEDESRGPVGHRSQMYVL